LALSSQNGVYLRPTLSGTSVTYFSTSGGNSYINNTGGNVGIGGITGPLANLAIGGNGATGMGIYSNASTFGVYGNATSWGVYGQGNSYGVGGQGNYAGVYGSGPHDFIGAGGEDAAGGVWRNASSRNLKENFTDVNSQEILNKIIALPITEWNYKTVPNAKYIGPIAEDFYALFGLGADNTSIDTVDPAGLALVGIKALNENLNNQQVQIASLSANLDSIGSRMTIDNSGNVGIGTASPDANAKLDVRGAIYALGESHFNYGTDPNPGFTNAIKVGASGIAVNGNSIFNNSVGIGTSPSYPLDVNGEIHGNYHINLTAYPGYGSGTGSFYYSGIANSSAGAFVFNNGVDVLSGNVGIKTTSPVSYLDLAAGDRTGYGSLYVHSGYGGPYIEARSAGTGFIDSNVADANIKAVTESSYAGNYNYLYSGYNNTSTNTYYIRADGYGWFSAGHNDLAENYQLNGSAERGEIVGADPQNKLQVTLANNNQSIMGIISTKPGAVMDATGGFSIGGDTKESYTNEKVPVAAVGSVPVIVTGNPGAINNGDAISLSTIPGIGAKATTAGRIVGNALESNSNWNAQSCPVANSLDSIAWPEDNSNNSLSPCFRLQDGTYVGKIMVFLSVGWYDPQVQLTTTGDLNLVGQTASATVASVSGQLIVMPNGNVGQGVTVLRKQPLPAKRLKTL